MATLRIQFNGRLGQISADSYVDVLQRSLRILRDLDKRMSDQRGGTLEWVVARVGEGSAWLDLDSRTVRGREDGSPRVHENFTQGLFDIQAHRGTPAYFSYENVVSVRDIVRQIGKDGVTGVSYGPPPDAAIGVAPRYRTVELTQEAESELQKLTGLSYRALGSIEGRVELVSLRRHARRFNITQERSLRSVRCNLTEALEGSVFDAMQRRRRVVASGLISYNAKNEPMALFLGKEPLRFLGDATELPGADTLAGIEPEMTGELSTEDFVASLRDG